MDSHQVLSRYRNLDDFWPFYLSQHSRRSTRLLHFTGTTLGLLCLVWAATTRRPIFLAWGLLVSYGLAWIGHFFFEMNAPATFRYPWLSFRADSRMYGLMWRGKDITSRSM